MLGSQTRLRALLKLGPRGLFQLGRFLLQIVPQAKDALQEIEDRATRIEDPAFRHEALTSIQGKSYHVAGGSFFATFLPPPQAVQYIRLIAPLESLYDYLDNLCDRHPQVPIEAFPVLHEALRDALDPDAEMRDYFRVGPQTNDGGYLASLVMQTRSALLTIPNYRALLPYLHEACEYYAALQTYKHYPSKTRVSALQAWHAANLPRFQELGWWEFAAGCGSQFHVYVLFFIALGGGTPDEAMQAYDAYFPEICAIHVLLDDFIDQAEDAEHGELNFITRYPSFEKMRERFGDLSRISESRIAKLDHSHPHRVLFRIMTLFYLTHPKVYEQNLNQQAKKLLANFA
ncbi:MAG: tetraprenyl-beta-curcumene synthase family protein [Candidatus Eremiobacteraeota bacterium]|nr:tetraprenyl-beta-curcumene synthase family protein [Candidatus Eremiobacteraeota bacterium]